MQNKSNNFEISTSSSISFGAYVHILQKRRAAIGLYFHYNLFYKSKNQGTQKCCLIVDGRQNVKPYNSEF